MDYELSEIHDAAKWFIDKTDGSTIFLFHGDMGAGKTTLIQSICFQIGISHGVTSPTFSIINEYISNNGLKIYHIDLYRIKNIQEAIDAGVEESLFSGNPCFVEWPSRAREIFPDLSVNVRLEVLGDQRRRLSLAFN